jgi:hypothetical protein
MRHLNEAVRRHRPRGTGELLLLRGRWGSRRRRRARGCQSRKDTRPGRTSWSVRRWWWSCCCLYPSCRPHVPNEEPPTLTAHSPASAPPPRRLPAPRRTIPRSPAVNPRSAGGACSGPPEFASNRPARAKRPPEERPATEVEFLRSLLQIGARSRRGNRGFGVGRRSGTGEGFGRDPRREDLGIRGREIAAETAREVEVGGIRCGGGRRGKQWG